MVLLWASLFRPKTTFVAVDPDYVEAPAAQRGLRDACLEIFGNISSVAVMGGYTLLGGFLFQMFELPQENFDKQIQIENWNHTMDEVTDSLYQFTINELPNFNSPSEQQYQIRSMLEFNLEQLNATKPNPNKSEWELWKSCFFAGTLFTTIGYGDRAPVTVNGRLTTIVYTLCGIPIMLIMLSAWGKLMFVMLHVVWKYGLKFMKVCPCLRCFLPRKPAGAIEEDDEEIFIPASAGVIIMILCMFLSAYMQYFIVNMKWSYFDCFWFVYISFTTIGLGDKVFETAAQFIFGYPLIVLEMSNISLCLNVVTNNIECLYNRLLASVESLYRTRVLALDEMDECPPIKVFGETWQENLLISMMDSSKLDNLQNIVDRRAAMRNTGNQAAVEYEDIGIQADKPPLDYEDSIIDEEAEDQVAALDQSKSAKGAAAKKTSRRSYIYAVTD